MLWKHCNCELDDKLVVGSPEYKEIIEESLGITCLYNDAVMEVMWGLQNLLHTVVPQEQSALTKEERVPMSKGLDMVLRRHNFDVKPEMINEPILRTANTMYNIDLREIVHSKYLHNLLDEEFMAISGVDIEDWSLFKLATAVKKMCYPDEGILLGDPYEMFSLRDLEIIEDDAAEYRDVVDKNIILGIYKDVVSLHENKLDTLYKLRCLVKEAKEALEAEEEQEKSATNGVDSKLTEVASTRELTAAESMHIIEETEKGENANNVEEQKHVVKQMNANKVEEEKETEDSTCAQMDAVQHAGTGNAEGHNHAEETSAARMTALQLTSNAEGRKQTEGSAAPTGMRLGIVLGEETPVGETTEILAEESEQLENSTKELADHAASSVKKPVSPEAVADDASSSVKPAGPSKACSDDQNKLPLDVIAEISNERQQGWNLFRATLADPLCIRLLKRV